MKKKSPIYIDSSHHRVDPSKPLPLPLLKESVGLLCPPCFAQGHTTPLKYIRQLATCWRVACGLLPPPGGGHYYKCWSFAQLNHEIASINNGNWPPIPYEPRQPTATPVASSPATDQSLAMFTSQKLIDQLFNPTASTSQAASPKKSATITCRGVGGRTSSHLPTDARKGNKQCLYSACASCCQQLGDVARPCPAKGHTLKPDGLNASTRAAAPAIHPVFQRLERVSPPFGTPKAGNPNSNTRTVVPLPHHRRLPPQSAQAGARLAQAFEPAQLGQLFDLRAERAEQLKRNQRLDTDETKVVKIIAWLTAGEPPKMYSFLATKWPKFSLDQCVHLVNEAALIEALSHPEGWSRALSIWDPTLDGWCTLSIDIPSRFPLSPRQILVKGTLITPDRCPRLDYYLQAAYNIGPSSSVGVAPEKATFSKQTPQPDEDDDEIIIISQGGPISTAEPTASQASHTQNDLSQEVAGQIGGTPALDPAKMSWPDNEAPMSHLLEWLKLLETLPKLRAWDQMFAARFNRGDRTVYRYASWLEDLGEERLRLWEEQQIKQSAPVTIGALRQRFHQEYLNLSKRQKPSTQSDNKKRKLGE